MNRRIFLALAGSGAVSTLLAGCMPPDAPAAPAPLRPSPAGPVASASVAPVPTAPTVPHAELVEITVGEVSARLTSGALTSRSLVEAYFARIDAIDRKGPTLRSVLETNPDALTIAQQLDDERRSKGPRGPLHGIPVLVKDNLDTGDRMQTTAGSLAMVGSPATKDSFVVARLREAGAIILGKTNLSEWANMRDAHSTSGWSGRGGLTRNPYALDRNTSGSSSGTAAAIAASLATVGIGTETDGSIVSPSSICGLVGLKPTVGLVSRAGVIPISHTQDTPGPMTRTVTDAPILLSAIAGVDPRDAATTGAKVERDYTRGLDRDAAKGKRIGAVRKLGWMVPEVETSYESSLSDLRKLGATVIDVELPPAPDLGDLELEILLFELKADMEVYLTARAAPGFRTLEDLVRFDTAHAGEELGWFGQSLFEKALKKGPLTSPDYKKAVAKCRLLARDEGIDALLKKNKLDALVAPTGGPAWLTDRVNGDSFTGSSSTLPAVAGYPSLTVPSGESHGLPLGIMFFGTAWSEPLLLSLAFAYEQATKATTGRRAPTYPATLAL